MKFVEIAELELLEQNEHWGKAIDLLYKLWQNDKMNSANMCRVIAECWYVMAEWDCSINKDELDYQSIKKILIETTIYGLENNVSDVNFLSFGGYMILMFPYFFYEGNDSSFYDLWENRGKEMLLSAVCDYPDNLIAKVFLLGTKESSNTYIEAKNELADRLEEYFPNNTAVEQYFKDVLS